MPLSDEDVFTMFAVSGAVFASFVICYWVKWTRFGKRVRRAFPKESVDQLTFCPWFILNYRRIKNPRLQGIHRTRRNVHVKFCVIAFLVTALSALVTRIVSGIALGA